MNRFQGKRALEDDKIEVAAQRTLEGWKAIGQPLEEEEPEQSHETDREEKMPADEHLQASAKVATITDMTEPPKTFVQGEQRKEKPKSDAEASLEKLTEQALSLLES